MRAEIGSFVDSHKLRCVVRVTGWISSIQVRNELLAARALVLPSFAKGLPVVIMEAMALRRSIISTLIAGIPELVRSGEHGWLVPAGDVKALVDAMRACIQAPEDELTAMGDAARERVLRFHEANSEATKLGKLFQAIASGHRFRASEDATENQPLSDPSSARTSQEVLNK
jgi:colanic acid/amylovoran biosynthesis glycosyltransferase